jgi:hypothetical protein
MSKATRSHAAPDVEALAAAAAQAIAREKSIARSKLAPSSVREQVLEVLRARGFEVTTKAARVPIAGQLEAVLRDGGHVPVKRAAQYVQGATAAEVKQAALGLVATGRARLVLRTATETLVSATSEVLTGDDLVAASKRLSAVAKQLEKAVRSQKGKGGWDLLREDVEQALRDIVLPSRRSPRKGIEENSDLDQVLRAIDSARDVSLGLSFVPKVIDLVAIDLDRAAAQRVLLGAASRGLVELRPEGGLNRLSDAELLACPEGPQGTRLSWVRRMPDES